MDLINRSALLALDSDDSLMPVTVRENIIVPNAWRNVTRLRTCVPLFLLSSKKRDVEDRPMLHFVKRVIRRICFRVSFSCGAIENARSGADIHRSRLR